MDKIGNTQSSFKDFLNIVFKRKKIVIYFFSITVLTVCIGTFLKKPIYEAKAEVLVKLGRENIYTPPNETKNIVKFTSDDQIQPEINLLQSRAIAKKVIEAMGLNNLYADLKMQDAIFKFQNSISATGNKTSNVITIVFRHKNPKIASEAVNMLVSVYLDQHLKMHQSPQSYALFEEQTKIFKNKLEASEKNLSGFKAQNNLTVLDEEQKLLLHQIADLNIESNKLTAAGAENRNRIEQLKIQIENIPKIVLQEEEVEHNPLLISNLEEKLMELELKEAELQAKYTPESRLVQDVASEIRIIKSKLSDHKTKKFGKSYTGPNTTYQRVQENLYQEIVNQKAIIAKIEVIKSQLSELQLKLDKLNKIELQFDRLSQSIDIDNANYTLYRTKLEEARISNEMDKKKISNINIIESAFVPHLPVGPSPGQNIAFSIFIGLIGGIGFAFLIEYFNDTIDMPSDVEKILQLPVIASIPDFKIATL